MKKSESQKTKAKKNSAQKSKHPQKPEQSDQSENPKQNDFLIVGIGASAGGVQALKSFFKNVAADSGAAYVVILHLSPDHDSRLTEILQTVSKIPVAQVKEKVLVESNHVYVVSPDESLTMRDGYIIVSPIHTVEERRAPVDIFFRTLAESHCSRAVAVVLSGTGANGSMGIKRVKENGGAAFVQNPREAEFSEMPRNSIATELIDEVLNVAEIPAKIAAYSRNLGKIIIPVEAENREEKQQAALREIFTLLRVRTGHDFSNYKRPTVLRRIERRINVRTLPDLPQYADYLKENSIETNALLKDLLISVTNFFRDKEAFAYLEREIVPRILHGKKAGDEIRLWIAGCATGEEAYSLAMLLAEKTDNSIDVPAVQIFATDIDEDAIAAARNGFYTLNDAADVSPERLRRFFTAEKAGFRIRRELREMILFANHNLLKDPPFSRLDLATCRNLLIYFNPSAQERVLETFHFALKPDGYLFLGTSESIDGAGDLYAPISREQRIFKARRTAPRISYPVPDLSPSLRFDQTPTIIASRANEIRQFEKVTYGDLHGKILEQFAPPSIIVNERFDIVHVSPNAGRYLEISGEVSNNLFTLIRPELRLAVSTAVYQAVQNQTNVQADNLKFNIDDRKESANVSVRPVLQQMGEEIRGFILIVFEQTADATDAPEAVFAAPEPVVRQLEEALLRSQSQQRYSVEQAEVQAEELKASNEELQAMNEELRSATEELETGKEELQSVNEELVTVNQELKIKIEELSNSNNDLQNLMNSTSIGTIFLDRSLRVKMFTPAACEIFNLIPADNGRILSDITHKIEDENLVADVETVLSNLQPIEREVRTSVGDIYLMQITPYRTADDHISGTIITFVNITKSKQAEKNLRHSEERYRSLFDSIDEGFCVFEVIFDENEKAIDYRFLEVNQAFERQTGLENAQGRRMLEFAPAHEPEWAEMFGEIIRTGESVRLEYRAEALDRWFDFYALRLGEAAEHRVAAVFRDITTRRRTEQNTVFLAEVSQALAQLTTADRIMENVGAKIGAFFNLSVCALMDVDETADTATATHNWHRADAASLIGTYRIGEFVTGEFQRACRAGEVFIVRDTGDDSRVDAGNYRAIDVGAFVSFPVVRGGEWRFLLVMFDTKAHDWRTDEIELMREITSRIWTSIERCRSEEAVRESEEKYRGLFDSIDEGFCVIEMLYDEAGKPFDYRFLETNPMFEKQSGIAKAAGKTISEIVPGIEAEWLATYGRVAETRKPARFENYTAPLDSWYDCYAFPTDAPEKNRVAVLFKDVTTRKRRETNLAFLAEFSQDLIPLTTERAIIEIFGEKINRLTNASVCAFFEINETREECVCNFDWHQPGTHSIVGKYDMREFMTGEFQEMMSAGNPVVVRNVAADSRVRDKEKFDSIEVGAFINIPLIREGEWQFALGVYHEQSYDWRDDEINLLVEVTNRIWTKLERTRANETVRESEARFRMLSESVPALIWVNGTNGCEYVNRQYLDFLGVGAVEDVRGFDWAQYIHPEDRDEYLAAYQAAAEERALFESQFRFRRRDGEYRWMKSIALPRLSPSGEYLGYVGSTTDITDIRLAEAALRESEERLRLIIKSVEDYAIITINAEGFVNGWNSGAEKIFGYAESEIIGKSLDLIFTPEDLEKVIPGQEMQIALRTGCADDKRWLMRRDGTRFFGDGVMYPLEDGKMNGFVKIVSDTTERLKAEQIGRDKEMLQKLVGAQEDERKRIARDLHDELGQLLTALRMQLEAVRKLCEDDAELCGKVDESQIIAKRVDDGIDFLAWELRPAALDDFGLYATLGKYIREWSRYSGVTAELLDSGIKKMRFDSVVETNLYRIAQESLNNVHKYAEAKQVEVSLDKRDGDMIVLIIEDDGRGFDIEDKLNRSKGIGLIGMRERAALIGGSLEIESAPDKGTTIYARVPASLTGEEEFDAE